jgi:hypothetical protein
MPLVTPTIWRDKVLAWFFFCMLVVMFYQVYLAAINMDNLVVIF